MAALFLCVYDILIWQIGYHFHSLGNFFKSFQVLADNSIYKIHSQKKAIRAVSKGPGIICKV